MPKCTPFLVPPLRRCVLPSATLGLRKLCRHMAHASGGRDGGVALGGVSRQHAELRRQVGELQHQVQQLEEGLGGDAMKNTAAQLSSRVLAGLATLASTVDSLDGQARVLWQRRLRALQEDCDMTRSSLERLFTSGFHASQATRQRQALFAGAVGVLRQEGPRATPAR